MAEETTQFEEPASGTKEDTEIVRVAVKRFKDSMKAIKDWRVEAEEDYAFREGDQWSQEDSAVLEEDDRPIITFNRVEPILDAVAGLEVTNRQETRYIPRELGDVELNERLTDASKWIRDGCDAEDEESEAFLDAVTCGMGWTETRMDYDDNPEGNCMIERRDPMQMVWDASAKKQNISDKRWVMYIASIAQDEFEDLFGFKYEDIKGKGPWDAAEWGNTDNDPHDATAAPWYVNDVGGEKDADTKIRVVQYQYKVRENYYTVQDPQTGQTVKFSTDRFKAAKGKIKKMGAKWVKQRGWQYKQAFIVGQTVIKKSRAPCDHEFSFKCITGKRARNSNTWYGLVRAMKDPNRWSNKFFSEILEVIQSGSKGGLMVEEGAVESMRKLENAWADPRSVVKFEAGALTGKKVQERGQAQYPQGLDRLMTFAIESIPQVTGINMELLGLAGKVQPGILEAQRKQAGLTILARLFNSLRRYRKEQGRVLLYFIQEYISDGRLIRVMGERNAEYVKLMKDDKISEYDVVVDDAPTSPNQKERVWGILGEISWILEAIGPVPEMFDYMPIPSTLAQAFKDKLNPQPKTEEEQAEAARKAELQKRGEEAEVEKIESEGTKNYAKANLDASKATESVIDIPNQNTGAKK